MIIRAHRLKVGDRFVKLGVQYRVLRIFRNKIYYTYKVGRARNQSYMSAFSSELIELISKATSQPFVQLRRCYQDGS